MPQRFEDMIVRQESKELCLLVYDKFTDIKDFGFKDQIQRASVSVMNNIAEGFERQTNNELARFLYIAKGSAGEVRSLLYLSSELGYIDAEIYKTMLQRYESLSRMLSTLIKKVQSSPNT